MNVHLEQDGILWAINRQIFHPRGFCLGLTEAGNFVLMGDGSETWHFDEALDNRKKVAFDRLLEEAGTQTDSRRPINAQPTNTVELDPTKAKNKRFGDQYKYVLNDKNVKGYYQVKDFIDMSVDTTLNEYEMVGIMEYDGTLYFGQVCRIVRDRNTGVYHLYLDPGALQIDADGNEIYSDGLIRIVHHEIIDIVTEHEHLNRTKEVSEPEPPTEQEINKALYLRCMHLLMADLPQEVVERCISTSEVGNSILVETNSGEIYCGKIWRIEDLKGSGYTITLPIDTFCVNRHGDEYYANQPIEIDSEEICDIMLLKEED